MKHLFAIIFLFFSLCFGCFGQVVTLHSFKESYGVMDKKYPLYAYSCWSPVYETAIIDMNRNRLYFKKYAYEIVEKPTYWIVKKDYKYCVFLCVNENLEKVELKFYRMDDGLAKLYINTETFSYRFVCIEPQPTNIK